MRNYEADVPESLRVEIEPQFRNYLRDRVRDVLSQHEDRVRREDKAVSFKNPGPGDQQINLLFHDDWLLCSSGPVGVEFNKQTIVSADSGAREVHSATLTWQRRNQYGEYEVDRLSLSVEEEDTLQIFYDRMHFDLEADELVRDIQATAAVPGADFPSDDVPLHPEILSLWVDRKLCGDYIRQIGGADAIKQLLSEEQLEVF